MFDELRARWRALLNPLQRDDIGWPLDSVDIESDVDDPEPMHARQRSAERDWSEPRAFR